MTILSDGELRSAIVRREILFDPPIDMATQIQPASVDLRLGTSFARFRDFTPGGAPQAIVPGVTDIEALMHRIEDREWNSFSPGEFWLATTMESVRVPDNMVARVEGRSSFGRIGLTIHQTAGLCDPGFEGQVTLEITNEGVYPIILHSGTRVCQLVFERLGREAEKPYGVKEGAKYQGQRGATACRIRNRE